MRSAHSQLIGPVPITVCGMPTCTRVTAAFDTRLRSLCTTLWRPKANDDDAARRVSGSGEFGGYQESLVNKVADVGLEQVPEVVVASVQQGSEGADNLPRGEVAVAR